ncbi:hypothetical protein FJTKL_08748 [Diaporthe vaccinii]|uniref:Uncharacterized protein n=1 Tax=Diaporthe vaccinii TaxID=105482 RepID=A0ABR4EQN3_9PEZI
MLAVVITSVIGQEKWIWLDRSVDCPPGLPRCDLNGCVVGYRLLHATDPPDISLPKTIRQVSRHSGHRDTRANE